jgi:6-pyruvoyl-tetrahydropterin synthase
LQSLAGIPAADDDAESAMLRTEKSKQDEYEDMIVDLMPVITAIKDGIATGDYSTANEEWMSLSTTEKQLLWKAPSKGGKFTTKEREIMKTSEFRQAQ